MSDRLRTPREGTIPDTLRSASAGVSRRGFLSSTALAAGAYGLLAGCASEKSGPQAKNSGAAPKEVFTAPAKKLSGSLSILMWSHFVPRHDKWFDTFLADWGKKVGVEVRVDHINTVDVPRRAASEIQAGRGHDLIQHIAPFSQYEPSVLDMTDVVQEATKRWGKQLELCRKSSYNPNTRRFYAYCPGWSPDPGDYRKSMWQKVGMPNGPASWDDLLRGAAEIKKQTGVPCGIGLSPETDSNMAARALLWSYGGSVQDENERVVLNSDATVEAVEFMARLFKEAETSEVFSWTPASNNQALIAGKSSYILNSISAWRTAMGTNRTIGDDIFFVPALRGPKAAMAAQHVIQQWIVPKYAANPDAAKEFLLHYTANFPAVTYHSEMYDLPGWPSIVPQLNGWLDDDPWGAEPANKLALMKTATSWSANIGYPGPSNPAIGEIFNTNVLPTMFGRAARGQASPRQAVAEAEDRVNAIFKNWRGRGLVGG
ncbi:ABC transporter substrate-binding protein [Actinomadura madurae]|uniref:ABC transporter substrate-binding protein n=1 Tax=Actinomadura madurae TaxID=1993 RepID=UPI002027284F|nr:extracellular solute-binding protein [Actinomadura madurae]MCP9953318.1 extracellular solute-binding protein [Actinomadura madurae]MCP9970076.1 extracellular solute-binding protein [Actinomadura madurae]MCP9982537.1 extracellular solute-binding protein [Actinomadura madurae]MCQ0005927.1 extracellular solute-binding protein [Actinomadura madurae]MCQ0018781.1 extracellular solute-binding protein [Actinomadura madurae]